MKSIIIRSNRLIVVRFAAVIALLLCCCCFTVVHAYMIVHHHSHHHPYRTTRTSSSSLVLLLSSSPSDSASAFDNDDTTEFNQQGYGTTSTNVVDTTAQSYDSTSKESIISKIYDIVSSSTSKPTTIFNQMKQEQEQRSTMNELLYQLEALSSTNVGDSTDNNNPNNMLYDKTSSPLLNGVWELKYIGGYSMEYTIPSPTRQLALFLYSGGYTPGTFAYTLAQQFPKALIDTSDKPIEITISRSQPRIEASVSIKLLNGFVDGTITIQSQLDILSPIRFRETYISTTISNFGIFSTDTINIPKQIQYSRDVYITYLDDDLLIVRDASGIPEVLFRKEKQFMKTWGNEPNALDDNYPPGDGEDAKF